MIIRRVNIKNYKSMEESGDINIGQDIFALIGQNNAGKSTVLDAIQCLFPEAKRSVEYKDLHDRKKDVIIEVEFSGVTEEYIKSKLLFEQLEKQKKELNNLLENNESPEVIARMIKKHNEKIDVLIKEKYIKYEIMNESMILRLIVPAKSDNIGKKYIETRTSGKQISDSDIKKILPILKVIPAIRNPQNESTAGNNSYMRDLIQMLDDGIQTSIEVGSKKINYNQLNTILAEESNARCKSLSEIITKKYGEAVGNDDFEINITSEVNIAKGTTYTTRMLDKVTNLESDVMNCGTGYQSMVILSILEAYVELTGKKNGYILIVEEPEVYLHPSLQRRMIAALIKLSKNNQVLFSTHSSISVSSLSKNQIGLVVKKDGKAHVEEIQIRKVISELGICPNDIMTENGVIIVEGSDDEQIIREILDKIDKEISKKINIIYTGSCTNLKFYANAEKLLNCHYNIPLLIIRDADSKTVEKQKDVLKKEITDALNNTNSNNVEISDQEIYIIGKHSLESLFLTKEILSSILSCSIEKCQDVIDTYNLVYDTQASSGMSEERFAKYYQPKYFFEKKLDDFGWKEKNEARDKWDESYYREWKKAITEICPNSQNEKFELFKEIREKLNHYTCKMAKEKRHYLLEIVKGHDLEYLKKSLFGELLEKLEQFIKKVE